jgi:hypothetical protein
MRDYRAAIEEVRESVRIMRGDDASRFRLVMGTQAYVRLREILDHGADPGPPNAWGSAPRSLLMLSGAPIFVEEKWPPNLWAVLDPNGNAIQGGILNALLPEGDEHG